MVEYKSIKNMFYEATQLIQKMDTNGAIGIGIALLFTLIITRKASNIKIMLLPMSLALITIGIQIHILALFLFGTIYAITLYAENKALTTYITGKTLNSILQKATDTTKTVKNKISYSPPKSDTK